jgi:ligand-binding SRPBCC domain-containing protein
MTRTVMTTSRLAAPPEAVWTHATTMHRINDEMAPWLRMTYPKEAEGLDLSDARVRPGEPLFVSWILLLGVLPVERWQLEMAEIGPGMRFVEQSRVLTLSFWRHERSVEAVSGGCILSDRLTFEPRLPGLGGLFEPVVRAFFAHRHRRLVGLFGAAP